MITKERLIELIKQNATILSYAWNEEIELGDNCEICKGCIGEYLVVHEDEDHHPTYRLDGLEEDIEKAKWNLEFGNITRTETLNLPTWEEIPYDRNFYKQKFCIKGDYEGFGVIRIWKPDDLEKYGGNIVVDKCVQGILYDTYFNKPLTKGNYTEACRLAKKLFTGESDE